ncbi:MAG: alpha-amylase family glycosyl hydrolase [Chloroflexota bacterium]|jgi:neopullulanase|nr:alpha-amylase family glycosyl hydrolase [Chloroflexota bacterium]
MSGLTHTPDWVKNAVFYQIFPDRFAKSDSLEKPTHLEPWDSPLTRTGFKGGDLLGVYEKLDYLQDLGINAIYLNPIFASAANHRYHTFDYYHVDPILGGNKTFFKLLEEAHRRDIRIVLDGVFNHASRGFFQFNHILENGEKSPYLDWFDVYGFPMNAYQGKPNYSCWWNLPALPQFNTDNPQVRAFLFEVAKHWIERGTDGWRLDVPFEIKDESFWRQFRTATKLPNEDAYLVGEIPSEAQDWLQGDMFDGVMNYQFTAACIGFFGAESRDETMISGMMGLPEVPVLDAQGFAQRTKELLEIYPRQNALAQLNLMDSHDTPRFLTMVSGNASAFRLATLFQMTYPGAPCIYYGNEIGLTGGREPENRGVFPWDESRWDHDLRNAVKAYAHLRHAHPVLRTGEYVSLYAEGRHLAYLRHLENAKMLIALNANGGHWDLNIPVNGHMPAGTQLEDLLGGEGAVIEDGHLRKRALRPWEGAVFQAVR